jgi:amino acid permease
MFSRDELLAGLPARRSSTLLFAIENRTAELAAKRRHALASYRTERTSAEREQAFLAALASGRVSRPAPSVRDLERHAPVWSSLVPPDPDGRATIVHLLAGKYVLPAREVPRIQLALGIDDPQVDAAYRRLYGGPVAAVLATHEPAIERMRWVATRVADRLEGLSPFWTAYVLALTETIGEGILAVPIALAGIGPLPGLVLLLVLGVINLVTIGGLVEAITRDGPMRYGSAYFGRLVRDLLGGVGTLPMLICLAAANAVILLAYLLGFASVLAGATGVPEVVWVSVLFIVNLVYLRREDLDMTVASAIVVGAANLVIIVAILALSVGHVTMANLAFVDLPFVDGHPFEPAVWALVLGVVLVAYDGGSAAANASKVVLAADPSGRSLLLGNLAAMVTVTVMYCSAVLVIGGAVGPTALATTDGTALAPLATVAGPAIDILGSIYVVLAIGLGSVYCSLGLYNQVLELLPRRSAGETGGFAGRVWTDRWTRFLIGSAPVFGVFLVLLALLLTNTASFAGSLSIVGVLVVPLMAGVYPMLLVAAARKRGAYVPSLVIRALGHPTVVWSVAAFFIASLLLYGLVIWTGPVERTLAIGMAVLSATIVVRAYRAGAFRSRLVIEVRLVDGSRAGRPVLEVGLTAAGRALSPDALDRSGGPSVVAVHVPRALVQDLEVWVHRVDDIGDSNGAPAAVTLDDGAETVAIEIDDEGRAVVRSIARTSDLTVTIRMTDDSVNRR